jgi:hypothetical protein
LPVTGAQLLHCLKKLIWLHGVTWKELRLWSFWDQQALIHDFR